MGGHNVICEWLVNGKSNYFQTFSHISYRNVKRDLIPYLIR